MKTLNHPVKFMVYSVLKALRHPRTPIKYYYCSSCKVRFNAKEPACPKCGARVDSSPDPRQESPIPWYGSVVVILIGVGTAIASGVLAIAWLGELSRALIYLPLGHLFGMSLQR